MNLPQSSLHQPSGCDLWVLALWCQIWEFSLPLKKTHSHLMHYYACYFLLATMNYNCFKNFMEKRHYINKKKSLHAGHVWYNYFFFSFFFFLLAWKWTFKDLWHGIHTFVLLSHDFFEFRTKKCNPRAFFPWKFASAPKLLWVTQNFSLPL